MFKNHIKLALKVLMRRKMFTFINLFGISFTLTILLAATTVYTLMVISNPIQKNLSKSLIVKDIILKNEIKGSWNQGPVMPYFLETCIKPLKDDVKHISFFSAHCSEITTYLKNKRIDIDTRETDENYWTIFSFKFLEGKPYSLNDIQNSNPVVVISKDIKYSIFGDMPALGKSINLNNKNYKIIGVVDNVPVIYQGAYSEVWLPYNYVTFYSEVREKDFRAWKFHVIIETHSRSDQAFLQKKINAGIKKLKIPERFNTIEGTLVKPSKVIFESFTNQDKGEYLIIILVLVFSLIPLINLTSLTISRIFERSSEIGVRKAFGATKYLMAFQFVYENIIVSFLGGIIGFLGAWVLLKAINYSGLIQMGSIDFNFHVFVYGLAVILLFGVISGFYPAIKMSKLKIVECLKGGKI